MVLLVNRVRCPLTAIAARHTDDRADNFDIYLPVARGAARLASTCGECHVAVGGGPHFAAPIAPWRARAHDIERHMVRHQWAADRTWEALVAHDDVRWSAGATIFASGRPLRRRDYVVHGDAVDGSVGLDRDAREIGERATTTVAWPARAGLYGELLATCAGCHKRWS